MQRLPPVGSVGSDTKTMNNPDVTGNNVDFLNLEVEGVLSANVASLQNLSVAGLPISSGIQTYRMPISTTQQTIPGGSSWTTVSFGGISNLILSPGQYLMFASGLTVSAGAVSIITAQARIVDTGLINTVAQIVFAIPVSSYSPFSIITYMDTSTYGLQFYLQMLVSADTLLLGSTNPANQFSPQFVAIQLKAI